MSQPGLLDWIEAGDLRRAAASLVVSHGADVLATCIAMVRDRVVAEDITQDVFSDAFRALATFRGDSSPRTWLLSIARNRCIDFLRARKRDPWGGALDESSSDPDEHADEAAFGSEWFADRSVVHRALDALAEGDRALVVLRFKNGLEYDELAAVFGLREGTVRMRVSRALARMRQTLEIDAQAPVLGAVARSASMPRAPMSAAPASPASLRGMMRGRSALGPASAGTAAGGGAPQRAEPSWWSRLCAWAGLGPSAQPARLSPPVHPPGVALETWETAAPSEALAARLGALIESIVELQAH